MGICENHSCSVFVEPSRFFPTVPVLISVIRGGATTFPRLNTEYPVGVVSLLPGPGIPLRMSLSEPVQLSASYRKMILMSLGYVANNPIMGHAIPDTLWSAGRRLSKSMPIPHKPVDICECSRRLTVKQHSAVDDLHIDM